MASIINASSSGSGGIVQTADASGVLQLQSNGTVALTVESGNIKLGTSGTVWAYGPSTTGRSFFSNSSESAYIGVYGSAYGSNLSSVVQFTAGTTNSMILNANGNFSLAGASRVADGVGICFPATQSASSDANTLDDYEEGTWTPTLVSTGGSAPAYTTQVARYYKIGGAVYVFGTVTINGTLPAGNYVRIQGLPFGQSSALSGVALKYSGATGVSSGQFLTAAIGSGEISFSRNDGNGEIGVTGVQASYISTTFSATFSTTYQVS